jgi:hypothetical protein
MPIVLPTEKSVAIKSPRHLVLYSPPKTGKTTLAAELPNSLLIDVEEGSDFVAAMRMKVGSYQELHELCEEVKKAGRPYIYGIIDTATGLEDMIAPLALKLYQQTPMASRSDLKKWPTGIYTDHILKLADGGGYLYYRQAYEMMLDKVKEAFPRTILLGHIKDKLINKGGNEVSAKDIDLTGKIKQIVCSKADAIGYLRREDNKCIVTFQTSDDLICGARPEHLRNKTIVLSEFVNGEFKTYWDKIYID